jgi:hypothetical protein
VVPGLWAAGALLVAQELDGAGDERFPEIYSAMAFSSEVDTGLREENASKQKTRDRF